MDDELAAMSGTRDISKGKFKSLSRPNEDSSPERSSTVRQATPAPPVKGTQVDKGKYLGS